MVKKMLYVNMQTNEISETSLPGSVEYEIIADEKEKSEILSLFNSLDKDSKNALQYIINYLDERPVDEEREKYGENLLKIYQCIYRLGTEKTKREIEQMGVLDRLKS